MYVYHGDHGTHGDIILLARIDCFFPRFLYGVRACSWNLTQQQVLKLGGQVK